MDGQEDCCPEVNRSKWKPARNSGRICPSASVGTGSNRCRVEKDRRVQMNGWNSPDQWMVTRTSAHLAETCTPTR
eukprot:scaffold4253_cov380-Pinguiococcus_pyrenoidosus.AAC.1